MRLKYRSLSKRRYSQFTPVLYIAVFKMTQTRIVRDGTEKRQRMLELFILKDGISIVSKLAKGSMEENAS